MWSYIFHAKGRKANICDQEAYHERLYNLFIVFAVFCSICSSGPFLVLFHPIHVRLCHMTCIGQRNVSGSGVCYLLAEALRTIVVSSGGLFLMSHSMSLLGVWNPECRRHMEQTTTSSQLECTTSDKQTLSVNHRGLGAICYHMKAGGQRKRDSYT